MTNIETIQRHVAKHFGISFALLISPLRYKSITYARHIAMYMCRRLAHASYPEIGRAFGNRDHTTVLSAVRKVEDLRLSAHDTKTWMLTETLDSELQAIWKPRDSPTRVAGEGTWLPETGT